MRCPFCGSTDTQVKDSRPAEDHVVIRRRRFCPACGGRFTTYERVQLRDLVVIKSSGKRENFDRDKLERSIRIAMQKRPIEPDRIEGIELAYKVLAMLDEADDLKANWRDSYRAWKDAKPAYDAIRQTALDLMPLVNK